MKISFIVASIIINSLACVDAVEQPKCTFEESISSILAIESLYEVLSERFSFDRAQLPKNCALKPEMDIYYELFKIRSTRVRHRLRCDSCGKVFKQEDYLNKHLTRKHSHLIATNQNNDEEKICTSKFCTFLHCAESEASRMDMHKHHNHPHTERGRQFCKSSLAQCFPLATMKKQYEFLVNYYCFGIYPAELKKSAFGFVVKMLAWIVLGFFLCWYLISSMCARSIKGKSTLTISPSKKNEREEKKSPQQTTPTTSSSAFGNSFLRKRTTPTINVASPSNANTSDV